MTHTMLSIRSDFSIGESILKPDDIIERVKAVGQKAAAITDTMSVTAMIDFSKRAIKADIKPIIGCRLRLLDDPSWRKIKGGPKAPPEYYPTIYVLTEIGMKAIYRLLSKANSEARFYNNAKLSFDDLYEELGSIGSGHLALSTGDIHGLIQHPNYISIIHSLTGYLGDHVYVNVSPINTPYWDSFNLKSLKLAKDMNLKTLATRPTCYGAGDADAANVMSAIVKNARLSDPWALIPHTRDFIPVATLPFTKEVVELGKRLIGRGKNLNPQLTEALRNTDVLVDSVTYIWSKMAPSLPVMSPNEFKTLVELCTKGWTKRFSSSVFAHKPTADELKNVYRPRLIYELGVLKRLGFSGYFLLVHDVVQFAKLKNIMVGPGRGSVGGSLVAYLCEITDCDPIRFGLLFERFINPDRIDLPDADLDFMSTRRHEIVSYLIAKYGEAKVAGVSNYLTLAAASTIRDVSKSLGLGENDYRCSRLAPKKHGQNIKLAEATSHVAEIKDFATKFPPVWDICLKIEGTMKTFGQHAAGIVVSACDLTERGVVSYRSDENVLNWDKRIVEDQGLIKMDILGLSTLDLMDLILRYIRERHSKRVDILRLPLDDEKVLKNFAEGVSTGVFQYEGGGSKRMLKDMASSGIPLTFDDVAAVSALNRPGPLDAGFHTQYIENRAGIGTVSIAHPSMEPVLAATYGVLVFQEQIMKISSVLSGFSGPEADTLRKAIGKKDPILMAKMKNKFVDGAEAGYAEVTLDDGRIVKIHQKQEFRVKENTDRHTIKTVMEQGFTLVDPI